MPCLFFIAVTFELLIFVVHLVTGIKLKIPIMCLRVKTRLSVFYNVFMYLIKSIEYPMSCIHTKQIIVLLLFKNIL